MKPFEKCFFWQHEPTVASDCFLSSVNSSFCGFFFLVNISFQFKYHVVHPLWKDLTFKILFGLLQISTDCPMSYSATPVMLDDHFQETHVYVDVICLFPGSF